mgnify:FL=1
MEIEHPNWSEEEWAAVREAIEILRAAGLKPLLVRMWGMVEMEAGIVVRGRVMVENGRSPIGDRPTSPSGTLGSPLRDGEEDINEIPG